MTTKPLLRHIEATSQPSPNQSVKPSLRPALESGLQNESVELLDSLPGYGETRRISGEGYTYSAFFSKRNSRIRVVSYETGNHAAMVHSLKTHGLQQQSGKIFLKTPFADADAFKMCGLTEEAVIKGYYSGQNAMVLSFFADEQRMLPVPETGRREQIITSAGQHPGNATNEMKLQDGFHCRIAAASDARELAQVFGRNFESYPFPVFDPEFILEGMKNNVVYMLVVRGEQIAAVASAETIPRLCNAEMTDFATMPEFRGKGLGTILLHALEQQMTKMGIHHCYTLCRAGSPSINRIFGKAGYSYTGTLVQNCHIGGKFEDMNCWCKTVV